MSVRASLVNKYGCSPNAELELADWRQLIIEELGGIPQEWNVICWAGYRCEEVECAGAGRGAPANAARLVRLATSSHCGYLATFPNRPHCAY